MPLLSSDSWHLSKGYFAVSTYKNDISFRLRNSVTLFFFYKNLFYKNVEAEIDPNFKNVLRTFLRLRVD